MPSTVVRVALDPARSEELWLVLARFEPSGVDEGNLANGDLEYLIHFPAPTQASECAHALAPFTATVLETIADQNWNAPWQRHWTARAVGQRFWLAPPEDPAAPPSGRIRLDYHPGTAFGNGDHPTTQMCLELLEQTVRPGDSVLDLGCGSGLLCEGAAALGGNPVGCDLDPAAVAAAHRRGISAFVGSIDAVRSADVVVANLSPGLIERLWPEISRAARRAIIVSGAMAGQLWALDDPLQRLERDGWIAGRLLR